MQLEGIMLKSLVGVLPAGFVLLLHWFALSEIPIISGISITLTGSMG